VQNGSFVSEPLRLQLQKEALMFETSVVSARAQAARGRLTLLTVSIAAHSAVIIGAVAVSIASVDFPKHAPDEVSLAPVFARIEVPPPLGDPNGGARQATPPAPQPRRDVPPPAEVTAPAEVPEDVPVLAEPGAGDTEGTPGATSTQPLGVPWGTPDSVGSLDAPPATVSGPAVEERIYQPHEVKPPVLLRRVSPAYPELARRTGMRGEVVVIVRCVIDRNGTVRDPQILKPAAFPPFNTEVVKAVQQWRFQPGSRDGVAVESYLDLTVRFTLN
jgi:protein TonB